MYTPYFFKAVDGREYFISESVQQKYLDKHGNVYSGYAELGGNCYVWNNTAEGLTWIDREEMLLKINCRVKIFVTPDEYNLFNKEFDKVIVPYIK